MKNEYTPLGLKQEHLQTSMRETKDAFEDSQKRNKIRVTQAKAFVR